ncbi:MAG: cytochrome oxidase subunit III [Saprospiraceae bacterium]|nr:cytochrome oxidase subunit III [Saprospiraceae bacterium]
MEMSQNNTLLKQRINPQMFGLYLGLASVLMMFAALTSAYMVRQAAGNWLEFRLPVQFFYSTAVIIISSVILHLAVRNYGLGKFGIYRILLVLSAVLGLGFVILQYAGWLEMELIGVYLTGNPSGSFVYIISGLHAIHVLGGLTALFISVLVAFMASSKVTVKRKHRLKLLLHYWHFVGALWIYLLLFLILQN